ncbi:MAG: hypothetical protein J6V38_05985 [Kiritimatiellae bacterium]|nr:hypothetical protein [Kiritimatiellia bacterium]
MVWTQYPYTNFHDMNMDWILQQLKTITNDINALNEWKEYRTERDAWLDESIADLNNKYADLMLLYNSFVDTVNAKFDLLSKEITDQVDALELRITRQVDDLEARVTAQVNALERELRAEMTAFRTSVDALLGVYNTRIIAVEQGLIEVENQIPNMMNIVDPYTGETNSIVNVIYEIVNRTKVNALTADAYDTAALTATAYDALALSAYEYDFNGADYIGA